LQHADTKQPNSSTVPICNYLYSKNTNSLHL